MLIVRRGTCNSREKKTENKKKLIMKRIKKILILQCKYKL